MLNLLDRIRFFQIGRWVRPGAPSLSYGVRSAVSLFFFCFFSLDDWSGLLHLVSMLSAAYSTSLDDLPMKSLFLFQLGKLALLE